MTTYRKFTEKEINETYKDYMYIFNILQFVGGAMYLKDLISFSPKSSSQTYNDVNKLKDEKKQLVYKYNLEDERGKKQKKEIVALTRMGFGRLGISNQPITPKNSYLNKNIFKLVTILNFENEIKIHNDIAKNLYQKHYLDIDNNLWKKETKNKFNVLENENILITRYEQTKEFEYYDINVFMYKINTKELCLILEDLYDFFINVVNINNFKIKISVITFDKIQYMKTTLNNIKTHKSKKTFDKPFRRIYKDNFKKGIDFYYLKKDKDNKYKLIKDIDKDKTNTHKKMSPTGSLQ